MKLGYGTQKQHTTLLYEGETNSLGQVLVVVCKLTIFKRHGIGLLNDLQAHTIYNGEFKNGIRDGIGTMTFGTGERYQGSWKDDLMHGTGQVTYPPSSKKGEIIMGDKFKGQFRFGLRVLGLMEFSETRMTYYDQWTDDTPGPSGQLIWKSGSHYKGQVGYSVTGKYSIKNYNIMRDGYGEMYWHDTKQRYMGHWRKDERKGYGILIQASGARYWGFWKKGKVGTTKNFSDFQRHGYGIELLEDGSFYEGSHANDERRGKGKICLPNGTVVVGDWSGNKVSNASMHQGSSEDVPKPLREIFQNKVVKQQLKMAEKSLFVTKEKWEVFVTQNMVFTTATLDYDCLPVALGTTKKGKILCSHLGLESLLTTIEKFSSIFIWNYEKPASIKQTSYRLHTATDDVLSFLECVASFMANAFKLSKSNKKMLYEIIIEAVFQRIFDCIYKLYTTEYRSNDNTLYAKMQDLIEVTPATMGVKPKWHLDKTPNNAANSSSPKALKMTSSAHRSSSKSLKPERTLPSSSKKKRTRIETQSPVKTGTTTAETEPDSGREDSGSESGPDLDRGGKTPTSMEASSQSSNATNISGEDTSPPKIGKKGRVFNLYEYQQPQPPQVPKRNAELSAIDSDSTTTENATSPNTFRKATRANSPQVTPPNRNVSKPITVPSTPPMSIRNSMSISPTTIATTTATSTGSTNGSPTLPPSMSNAGTELARDLDLIDALISIPELENLPYRRVIKTLMYMSVLKTPLTKMQCLTAAASAILSCVDEFYSEKKEKILMGAEDKFPVLIYAVIRANQRDLHSQLMFLSDFSHELVGDEEYKYRISELSDAIKYINSLEWQIRDENNILVPLKMILSSVATVARSVTSITFDTGPSDLDLEAEKILQCASSVFLGLSQRSDSPYTPYRIKPKTSILVRRYTGFFKKLFEANGTGLLFTEEADNDSDVSSDAQTGVDFQRRGPSRPIGLIGNFTLLFKFKLPLYVYSKLAEVVVAREVTPEMLS